jgi:hypothetical protein
MAQLVNNVRAQIMSRPCSTLERLSELQTDIISLPQYHRWHDCALERLMLLHERSSASESQRPGIQSLPCASVTGTRKCAAKDVGPQGLYLELQQLEADKKLFTTSSASSIAYAGRNSQHA